RRSSGQDHFAASALPDSRAGTGGDYGSCPPPMRVPDPALRSAGTFVKCVVIIFPHWSRPSGFHVRSMFARMSRYHPVAPLLIRGFGVRVPGGAPVLTWGYTPFRPRR